jgi:hypothetical protein
MTDEIKISWSSLRVWEECRQKSWLVRQGKKSPLQDVRLYLAGNVTDLAMRRWLSSPNPQPGEMASTIAANFDECEQTALEKNEGIIKWKSKSDKKEMTEFCVELVTRLEPILYQLVIPYEYEPAKRFRVPIMIPGLDGLPEEIHLTGEMDLLTRSDDKRFNVWDLKGTANDSYWRQTFGQLVFYDLAVNAMFGEFCKEVGLIQPMCKQRVLSFTLTPDDHAQMMARIIRMAHGIWRNETEPKQGPEGCSWCQMRLHCAKFAPVGDVNERRLAMGDMQSLDDLLK